MVFCVLLHNELTENNSIRNLNVEGKEEKNYRSIFVNIHK